MCVNVSQKFVSWRNVSVLHLPEEREFSNHTRHRFESGNRHGHVAHTDSGTKGFSQVGSVRFDRCHCKARGQRIRQCQV